MFSRLLSVVISTTLCSIAAFSQTLSLVNINVNAFQDHSADFYAFDSQNRLIRNLTVNDFAVTNGSSSMQVTSVSCPQTSAPQRLSVVLCLDVSGSMSQESPSRMSTVRNAASLFVNMLDTTQNECAVTSFDHLSYINQDFTTSKSRLLSAISTLQPQGATDYNNALLAAPTGALNVATRGQYKRVVVLMTDGDGGGKLDSIVNFARMYNITIYTISYHLQAPQILYDMATQTGGVLFGDLNYESLTTSTQLQAAFRASLVHAQGIQPCTVHWWADRYCYSSWRYVTIAIPSLSIPAIAQYYILPYNKIPYVGISPYSLTYGAVLPGTTMDKSVVISATNARITIDGGTFTNAHFTILSWGGSPPPFSIDSGQSRTITVRYTSTDTTYQFGSLQLQSNMCYWAFVGASAGYQARSVPQRTISVLSPVAPENYNSCYYSYFRWDGVAANDSVRVEWSYDDGKTWSMLTDNFSGNFEQWFRTPQRTGTNNKIRISHLKFQNDRLQSLKSGHAGMMRGLALNPQNQNQAVVYLNPDNAYLATKRAYVINLITGDTLATLTPGSGKVIQSVMWSADGSTIITCQNGAPGGQISFWNATTYQLIRSISDATTNFSCVAINSAGTRVAVGLVTLTNSVRVYDASNGTVLSTLNYHAAPVTSLAFCSDGSRLASVDQAGRLVVWNMSSYARINNMDVSPVSAANSVNFNPTVNDLLVVAYQSGVTRIWSTLAASEVRSFNGNIGAHYYACYNANATRVLSCGETAQGSALYRGAAVLWDATNASQIVSFDGTTKINQHNWRSYAAVFTADGAHIVSANNYGGINVWTSSGVHERQLLVRNAARGAVVSGCFFSSDQYVATMGEDGSVAIHSTDTKDVVQYFYDLNANASKINQVRVSPSGVFMAALSADLTMALWNIQTQQLIARIPNAGYGPAFSGNSQYVAVVRDSVVSIYVTATGALYRQQTISNFLAGRDLCYNYNDSRLLVGGVSTVQTMSIVALNTTTWTESGRYTDTYYIGGECTKMSYAPGAKFVTMFHTSSGRSIIVDSTMTRISTLTDYVHAIAPNAGYEVGTVLTNNQARVWRVSDNAVIRSVNPHQGYQVSQIAMSENSSRALICSHDGNAWLWDYVATPIQMDTSDTPFSIGTSILKTKDTINFGKVLNNGSKDSVINQIIMNIGTAWDYIYSVSITGYNKDEFRIVKKNTGLYLYPGQSLTYELGFIPRTKVVGIKQVEMKVVTLCDTLRFVLIGESVEPPTENLVDQIDFGKVEVTTQKDTTVSRTIQNVTNAPLTITSTRILGPDTTQFSIISGGGSFVLQPRETRTITLRFAPVRIARTSARLAFFHAFLGSPATVLLAGEGIGIARIAAPLQQVAMKSIICSALSPIDSMVRINNIGTGVMRIDSTQLIGTDSMYFRVMSSIPDTISAGSGLNLRVRYVPQFAGSRRVTLRVFTNAQNVPNGTMDFTLIGTRDTVILSFGVSTLDLLNVRPYSSVDVFTNLTNRGSVPMWLPTPVTLGKFTIMSMTPNPIPSGVTARVFINFNNGDTSMVYDTLYTVKDTCGGASSLRLRAYTQSPKATLYVLSSVDISSNACEKLKDTTIILTNVGMLNLTLSDVQIIDDTLKQFSILHLPQKNIAPDGIDSIVIRYLPTTTLKQNAMLRITSNAQNAVNNNTLIPLNGTWVYTAYTLDSSVARFTNVPPNTAASTSMTLVNTGTSPLQWTLPQRVGLFSVTAVTPNPTPPGVQATCTVTFSGAPSGSIIIDSLLLRDQCGLGRVLELMAQVQTLRPRIRAVSMPDTRLVCVNTRDTFIIVQNVGLDTLRLDSLRISAVAPLIVTGSTIFPRILQTQQRDTIRVHIDASGYGTNSAVQNVSCVVYSNSEADSVLTTSMTVRVVASNLSFSPQLITFPKLRPNRQNTQQILLNNTGQTTLAFSLPIVRAKFSIDSIQPNPVLPGTSATAFVRFAGDSVGIYTDSLMVPDSCGRQHALKTTVEVARAVPPHLQTIASLRGTEECYTAMDTTVLLTNTGGDDLTISRMYLQGTNANEFSIENDTSIVLGPEQTHLVLIRHLSHGVTGVREADLVIISDNDSLINDQRIIHLQIQKDSVDVQWDQSLLHFGIVSRSQVLRDSLTLRNRGTLQQLVAMPLGTQFFRVDSIVPNPIPAGAVATAYIRFNVPDSVGFIKESLVFMNHCSRPVVLDLAGQIRAGVQVFARDTTVQIGDVFQYPVYIRDAREARLAGLDTLTYVVRWNTTMMALRTVQRAKLVSSVEDGPMRIVTVQSDLSTVRDSTLAVLELQAALGNDTLARFTISDVRTNRGVADLTAQGATVYVTGQCRDGGLRLMDRKNPTALRAVYPNPSDGSVKLDLSTPERAMTTISVVDELARVVRILYSGVPPADEWQYHAELHDLPVGVYQVIVRTPTAILSKPLEIVR